MTNMTLKEQLIQRTEGEYPYVRRDKTVRALVIAEYKDADTGVDMVLIETMEPRRRFREPCKRTVTKEYFDNNYWVGKD